MLNYNILRGVNMSIKDRVIEEIIRQLIEIELGEDQNEERLDR